MAMTNDQDYEANKRFAVYHLAEAASRLAILAIRLIGNPHVYCEHVSSTIPPAMGLLFPLNTA